ncbi:S24 family peptidase [Aromatoleum toluclasticum]|uniref:S24 family peptidase n=1 Tax=Aromatoleum toluclasticum TaxID=92003 RepID=UPI0003AAEE9E|nr:S24 family peptidase [Aromatoleum toluclasticum]
MHKIVARLIDQLLDSRSYPSVNAIAKDMGMNQPTLARIYNGESLDPKRESVEKIAKFFHLTVDDLYRDARRVSPSPNGHATSNGGELPTSNEVRDNRAEYAAQVQDSVEIPQYDVSGAMGNDGLMLADQPGVIKDWHVTPEWLTKNVPHCTGVRNLCIVTGFGDSMRPLYNPGDPLLVDIGVRKIEADAVYFFRVGSEGYIKRIQRIPGRGYLVKSANPEYETWTITPDMEVQVLGRVLMAWRSEKF